MNLKSLLVTMIAVGAIGFSTNASARGAVGPAYTGGAYGYVCTHEGSNVMLRAGAGQNHKVLARMPSGSDVAVVGERSVGGWTWYKVKFGRTTGWARADYICG